MTNANDPVHFISSDFNYSEGITKREYFAAMAMQGMLANINQTYGKPNVNEQSMEQRLKEIQQFIDDVANKSVTYSNALIKALNENQ